MSSILTYQGMVLATAMAVSGTVILLALRLQKPADVDDHTQPHSPRHAPRSCILSDGKRREKNKKKRVHFAEDVVDPTGYSEEFRRQHRTSTAASSSSSSSSSSANFKKSVGVSTSTSKVRGMMPANRMALYNGILRDRVFHRMAYSY